MKFREDKHLSIDTRLLLWNFLHLALNSAFRFTLLSLLARATRGYRYLRSQGIVIVCSQFSEPLDL